MTDRDPLQEDQAGGGGMTGATGKLTPEESDEEFTPAEWRESVGTGDERNVTDAFRRESDAMHRGQPDDPERLPLGDPHSHATRDAGYGSEHGLAANDPAHRMERHPSAAEAEALIEADEDPAPDAGAPADLGGDVRRRPEDERF